MFQKVLPVILALAALPAHAGITYYVGAAAEASFQTALIGNGLTASGIINFTGATPGTTVSSVGGSGVDFAAVSGSLAVNGSTLTENYQGGGSRLDVNPTTSIYALGLHLVSASTSLAPWCFEAPGSGSCDNLVLISSTAPEFFGVISTSPISSFTIRAMTASTALSITNFEVGTLGATSETPEPSTFAMLGGALTLFPLVVRRKRRAAQ